MYLDRFQRTASILGDRVIELQFENQKLRLQLGSMLELADILDSVTNIEDPTKFVRGIAHGIRERIAQCQKSQQQ